MRKNFYKTGIHIEIEKKANDTFCIMTQFMRADPQRVMLCSSTGVATLILTALM